MINEDQAEFLLSECEVWLATKLNKLRSSLRGDHEHTTAILWELIVLNAVATSVNTRHSKTFDHSGGLDSLIQHEPTDAAPDIFLYPDDCEAFYLEIAHIRPRNQQQEEDVNDFPAWIRKQLILKGISYANSLAIRLDSLDSSIDIQVPARNCWKKQLQTDKWKSFVTGVSLRSLPVIWIPEQSNVIVTAERIGADGGAFSSFPAQNVPNRAEDHPVYKTIKNKAEQAKAWERSGKKYQPLVLILGASASLHQITNSLDPHSISPEKAIYSALADEKELDLVTRLNLTDNRSWPWAMRRQRVSGSRRISAVVLVTIGAQYSGGRYERRANRPLIIKNPHPNFILTAKQEWFLEQIDFNRISYSPSWEDWEKTQRDQETPLLNKHIRESHGRFVFSPLADFAFGVEIRHRLFTHLLIGNVTADEVWARHGQNIGSRLKSAVNIRQPIVSAEFVRLDPKLGEESRVRLEFGGLSTFEKNDKKCHEDSIEIDDSGAFSVTLSTSFVAGLMSGKTIAEETWRSESQQKIRSFLRDAVDKKQEIIDLIFVENSSESEYEPQIIFRFRAPTDTLIREDKKRLREFKKQDT